MKTITKIACRTIGALGMGIALYDASRVASYNSKTTAENVKAAQMETSYFNSRTIDKMSYHSNGIRQKVQNFMLKSPIPTVLGKVKGWVECIVKSLGNHIITIGCATMALLCKGFGAKLGAIGIGLGFLYEILRNGFGAGKHHPMD